MPGPKAVRTLIGLVSAAVLIAPLLEVSAAVGEASEQQVKAAFLVNFARYVKWPSSAFDSATDPIVIGIYGDGRFVKMVAEVTAGKEVGGRSLKVVACSDLREVVNSHILFIGSSQASNYTQIIHATKDASVFSVSDFPGFAKAGGVANFVFIEKRIRFEINEQAAKEAGLTVSSKLLRLAMLVE